MGLSVLKRKRSEGAPPEGVHHAPRGARERALELPPFQTAVAIANAKVRAWRAAALLVAVVSVGLVALQEWRFHGVLAKYANRELLVVPGAVDFMRVRPNMLPDAAVYEFAEYIAGVVANFSYHNVEQRALRLGELSTPEYRERAAAELRQKLKSYQELRVSETFYPNQPTQFELKKDGQGNPYYVVNVEGRLDRYSNDSLLLQEDHIVTVTFRTTRIVPDKPWLYEVMNVVRRSREEWARETEGRARLAREKP